MTLNHHAQPRLWRKRLNKIITVSLSIVLFAAIAVLVPQDAPVPGSPGTQVSRIIGNHFFDFPEWLGAAWLEKLGLVAVPVPDYLIDAQRSQMVLTQMQRLNDWSALEWQVRQAYTDSATTNPDEATQSIRAQRDALRADIERDRPLVEAILQQQISSVLVDEGFGSGGEIFPPVAARVTPLPYVLILSPRDAINRQGGEALQAGLGVEEADRIETQVLSMTDQAALVVPIGGLAAYPTMLQETGDLLWLTQTMAHEWVHNWLDFRPLGYNYLGDSPVIRIINETTASVAGDEIGLAVMRRYYPETLRQFYPDLVEPRPLEVPNLDPEQQPPPTPRGPVQFSYNNVLYETRVKVEEMLAEARRLKADGQPSEAQQKIVEAETYMEEQRQYINSHGYTLRKLNQAYFAFYGAYADQPGGAAGRDLTGPHVVALRAYSPSLRAFLDRISGILSLEDLQHAVAELHAQK